jgi:hypothetical protein
MDVSATHDPADANCVTITVDLDDIANRLSTAHRDAEFATFFDFPCGLIDPVAPQRIDKL